MPTAQGGQAWHASTVPKMLASQQADAANVADSVRSPSSRAALRGIIERIR
ncbi:hypothetical protein [Mycobacterium sp.]|uniref:hypothetical protein n=1 Tax=Mycobacterium sp. TaxID=1785 RepID=UPI003C73A3D9